MRGMTGKCFFYYSFLVDVVFVLVVAIIYFSTLVVVLCPVSIGSTLLAHDKEVWPHFMWGNFWFVCVPKIFTLRIVGN